MKHIKASSQDLLKKDSKSIEEIKLESSINQNFIPLSEKEHKKSLKKGARALLRIIKSKENAQEKFSERDEISVIQGNILQKAEIIKKKFSGSSIIDLSIEDQRNKLNELLKKKLDIYHNTQVGFRPKNDNSIRFSVKTANFFTKSKENILNHIQKKNSFLKQNIHVKLRKSLEKLPKKTLKAINYSNNIDLSSCISHLSFQKT